MSKCRECFFGGIKQESGSMWIFKKVIRKNKEINYNDNESGCRIDLWIEKEKKCLSNDFSEFLKFKEIKWKKI